MRRRSVVFRSRRPEEGEELARADLQVHVLEHMVAAIGQVDVLHLHADRPGFDIAPGRSTRHSGGGKGLSASWAMTFPPGLDVTCRALARGSLDHEWDAKVAEATSRTATMPSAAPAPRPAGDCMKT
jgi:hypothetical protein